MKALLSLFCLISMVSCKVQRETDVEYSSADLKITRIAENTWIHTSYLEISNYRKFPCNGMIYVNDQKAIVFDTTVDNETSQELIAWIQDIKGYSIKAVIINHFHNDCLGGLEAFHAKNIDSYANDKTIALADFHKETLPKNGFQNSLELELGDELIVTNFFGPGHTSDNVVSYIPTKKVLFGGCLIKALGAAKGNLADSNIERWSETVARLKKNYDDVNIVIPGHGEYGGKDLLEYTIKLFKLPTQ